jgi:predicted MFS family arabinose efflux permease
MLGLGNLIWVPLSSKFGKRASLILAMLLQLSAFVWTAKSPTYSSLLAARCISGFAAAAGEVGASWNRSVTLANHHEAEHCSRNRH